MNSSYAQSVNAPVYAVGEKWEFMKKDLWTGKVIQRYTVKNIGIAGDYLRRSFETTNISANGDITKPQFTESTVRADMNENIMFHGEKSIKVWYKWPLEIGKKWSLQSKSEIAPTAANAVAQTMVSTWNAEVVQWENVDMPSGKVKALKIVYKLAWTLDSPTGGGDGVYTVWYSPEQKNVVQSIYETFTADGSPQLRTITQLVLTDGIVKTSTPAASN
ncbi:hypothetical protein [Solimicrobium silvestre]|nr:hypothetical protein [Solimicrobium silvestre]